MKCERCHEREATKALSVAIDGQASTLFVCDECAAKEPPRSRPGQANDSQSGQVGDNAAGQGGDAPEETTPDLSPLADILMDMAKMVSAAQRDGKPPIFEVHVQDGEGHVIHHRSSNGAPAPETEEEAPSPQPECPVCHMTLDRLRDGRRLGCPQCYETFRDEIPAFTRELQYDDRHVGKKPAALARDEEIRSLKKKLRRALARQRYEEASGITERIRGLGGEPGDDARQEGRRGETR